MQRALAIAVLLTGLALLGLANANGGLGAAEQAVAPPARFGLVRTFSEDFDAGPLDRTIWRTSFGPGPDSRMTMARRTLYTNRERQVYVAPEYLGLGIDPFRIAQGQLQITARPLDTKARAALMQELATLPKAQRESPLKDVAYSSGLITSRGHLCQKYGYFEARMRWTGGQGIWPAFWLLPDNDRWPPEIDIMEALGNRPRTIFQSRHWTGPRHQSHEARLADGDPSRFHTYGVLWTQGALVYFIDNVATVRFAAPRDATMPMCLLLNLAVGGYWPKDPTPETKFPARLDIDWVRAWRLPEDWNDERLAPLALAETPAP